MPSNKKSKNNKNYKTSDPRYDVENSVFEKTYGALAELRRQLSDSKSAIQERTELLRLFANCRDLQRAWILLEDYFQKLQISRKDFDSIPDWWQRVVSKFGNERLEELCLIFYRSHRPLPTELSEWADPERLAKAELEENLTRIATDTESWLIAPDETIESPKASIIARCSLAPYENAKQLKSLSVQISITKPRQGEKIKSLAEIKEIIQKHSNEREFYNLNEWSFIEWIAKNYSDFPKETSTFFLTGLELLRWITQWGHTRLLCMSDSNKPLNYYGHIGEFFPDIYKDNETPAISMLVKLADGVKIPLDELVFFAGHPTVALLKGEFIVIKNPPGQELLDNWLCQKMVPIQKFSPRFISKMRGLYFNTNPVWDEICKVHTARPRFIFEMDQNLVRLRLQAISDLDNSLWEWTGHEWIKKNPASAPEFNKKEFLDDHRLTQATQWLDSLGWFNPEPGLWLADANVEFFDNLANAWAKRPADSEYLGNSEFKKLLFGQKKVKPKLHINGFGIDWFSVSAEWESECIQLTKADLECLASANSRFIKLPDAGWVEIDIDSLHQAKETVADFGLDSLSPLPQQVNLLHAVNLDEITLAKAIKKDAFYNELKERIKSFKGIPPAPIPNEITAKLRPYQKDGFDFLCYLSRLNLGGILADDMGLGKTIQTLTWLVWLNNQNKTPQPSLVICPASVLHNWRREAERFTPTLKVLVLESGAARHNLRKTIPDHQLIVTNYALLRRDLEELQKFEFLAIILDEAQFIKNPDTQITTCVKQLKAKHRLALTGTPLENKLLDLWSIVDFVQPGYLGPRSVFEKNYESTKQNPDSQRLLRKRLAAKIRPIMLRRLKQQVAKDLPARTEQRRDCELHEEQKKLYLAELKKSREIVFQTIAEQGISKSKIHVLAALTRLRQICCHPLLTGVNAPSGKTDTLFELLDPLLAEGQRVLIFSQFVEMLKILDNECQSRSIPTYIITGDTKNRMEIVQRFQNDPRPSVFLLSLRAAGTGLNLTSASYVVLYDPWWNPAVEAQAIDRSHRIGQTKPVNAYRLIAPGTVEEKIWELQQKKSQTIADVLGEEGFAKSLSKDELQFLFEYP